MRERISTIVAPTTPYPPGIVLVVVVVGVIVIVIVIVIVVVVERRVGAPFDDDDDDDYDYDDDYADDYDYEYELQDQVEMGTPRAVLFDAAGTLVRCEPSVGAIYSYVAARHGATIPAQAFDRAFADLWPAHRQAARRAGHATSEEVERRWWRVFTGAVAERVQLPGDVDAWFEDLWREFARPGVWRLFPDVEATLAALRARGVRIGILTNWDARCLGILGGLGLTSRVDFVLVSSQVGTRKPGEAIFAEALRRAGVGARDALHVGDSLEDDYEGARAAGLEAVLLRRRTDGAPPAGVRAISRLDEVVQFP